VQRQLANMEQMPFCTYFPVMEKRLRIDNMSTSSRHMRLSLKYSQYILESLVTYHLSLVALKQREWIVDDARTLAVR
jgi:hypothetical protein